MGLEGPWFRPWTEISDFRNFFFGFVAKLITMQNFNFLEDLEVPKHFAPVKNKQTNMHADNNIAFHIPYRLYSEDEDETKSDKRLVNKLTDMCRRLGCSNSSIQSSLASRLRQELAKVRIPMEQI